MPRAESARVTPRSPPDPHRVALPNTPAAASRSNPIDRTGSPEASTTSRPVDQHRDEAATSSSPPSGRRASSEAPVSRPHPTVTRSTSTGSSGAAATRSVPAIPERTEPAPAPATAAAPAPAPASAVDETNPIDMETFDQIIELDDGDPDRPFSKDIVDQYFQQFESTSENMQRQILGTDEAGNVMPTKTLKDRRHELYKLGHFLKGSSAALGVEHVKNTCERIQHLGDDKQHDPKKPKLSDEDAIKEIRDVLFPDVQRQFNVAKAWFIANGYGKPPGGV